MARSNRLPEQLPRGNVDADRVRGLLAPLDEGIVEGPTEVEKSAKLTGVGLTGLAEHSQRWGSERTLQESQGDALFPSLESALEGLGLLRDISQELSVTDYWDSGALQDELPPGSLVLITAVSSMFDARNSPFDKPAPKSLRRRSGRKPGGQSGHPGETLRQVGDPDEIVRHEPEVCRCCGLGLVFDRQAA